MNDEANLRAALATAMRLIDDLRAANMSADDAVATRDRIATAINTADAARVPIAIGDLVTVKSIHTTCTDWQGPLTFIGDNLIGITCRGGIVWFDRVTGRHRAHDESITVADLARINRSFTMGTTAWLKTSKTFAGCSHPL